MEKAKRAVEDFVSKSGHDDTTLTEQVAPSVTHETVKPMQHEQIETAVDKEIHQDHHRRIVQPVKDQEILPEQHVHKAGKVINREFDHRDTEATERALRAESSKYRNERTVEGTTYSQSHAPTVQGEQIHHHVTETVQPIIEKETIQPKVVHTTVPIHEVHHEQARDHGTTTMPAVSMDEFKRQGGTLGSSQVEPSSSGIGSMGTSSTAKSTSPSASSTTGNIGLGQSSIPEDKEKKKPSLLDRLNPMKDAEGRGW
ncbi:hypothetical protein OQA88_55 [Cercophora sp. LCS_1]